MSEGPRRIDFYALMWDMLDDGARCRLCNDARVFDGYALLDWYELLPHVKEKIGEAVVRLAQLKAREAARRDVA